MCEVLPWATSAPSSMLQDFLSGSAIFQPSKDLPSKIFTKPASASAAWTEKVVSRAASAPVKIDFMRAWKACPPANSSPMWGEELGTLKSEAICAHQSLFFSLD